MNNQLEPAGRRWLPCRNGTAEVIPAFGVVRITSADSAGVLTVGKPNADGQTDVFFNGSTPIPASAAGAVSDTVPCKAAYDTGTPAAGQTWGAKSGQWTLSSGQSGFLVLGGVNSTALTVNVTRAFSSGALARGKLDGALAAGGSAVLSVWAWNGTAVVDTGENLTVYDWLLATGQSIATGKKVVAAFVGGQWVVISAEC